jgi:hypothetical protein
MLQQFIPWFGYFASFFLILALITTRDLKFRWFNLLGNISFIVYALMLPSIPVLITNSILMGINVYYLYKIYNRNESFDLLEIKGNEPLVKKFLSFYEADIQLYFPDFKPDDMLGNLNFVVLRDLVTANIFSARILENGDAKVLINYTVQRYRDYKVGQYIFDKEKDFLTNKNIKRIMYQQVAYKGHLAYLKKMGFTPLENSETGRVKSL